MNLKFMYITNNVDVALVAESAGVDRVFVDLETLGKAERQKNMNAVLSRHTLDDVNKMASVLTTADVLTRVNPINEGSKAEIDAAIDNGTDLLMLPMFKTKREVERFVELVDRRVPTICLLETREAAESLDDILTVNDVDEFHIGLNDLHLSYGLRNMFELLVNGTVEKLCAKIKATGKPYGFGGVARVNQGAIPANLILAEHARLGSSAVILSRAFYNTTNGIPEEISVFQETFAREIKKIRRYEQFLSRRDEAFFDDSRELLRDAIDEIINQKK